MRRATFARRDERFYRWLARTREREDGSRLLRSSKRADGTKRGGDIMANATRGSESTVTTPALMMAFELSARTWLVGFRIAGQERIRRREIPARDTARVVREMAAAKAAF